MYRQNFVFSAEIVLSGPDGVAPTIVVATPLKKYHFNVAEGFGRLAMEHGVKVDHTCSVFFTFDHSPASAGGLGGLLFRLREIGAGKILFVGPKGINEILEGFKMLSYFREPMAPSCSPLTGRSQGVVYGDDFVDVAAVIKNWERSSTPSWLGACPRWVWNPKQVVDLVSDDELEEGEIDEEGQDVIVIDIGESDDDADNQSARCLSNDGRQAEGPVDLVTSDEEVQAAGSALAKSTSSGTASSGGGSSDGGTSSSASDSSSTSPESKSGGDVNKPMSESPGANSGFLMAVQCDPGGPKTAAGVVANVATTSHPLEEMISLGSDTMSSGDEDCVVLPECKQALKQSSGMQGEVRHALGLHRQNFVGLSVAESRCMQQRSVGAPHVPCPGLGRFCAGAGMDCQSGQAFTQGAFHPEYAKQRFGSRALPNSPADMEVDPVLAFVMRIKATGQILAFIRLTDAESKEDLESHPVFKGLKHNRSRVSTVFHILRPDMPDLSMYQKWTSCLPGKQIMVKWETQGLCEPLGHQKVLRLTGRLHPISSLFFPLPYEARRDPATGVEKGCELEGAVEGGLLFKIEQSLGRELEVIPGCPAVTSLGSLAKEARKAPEVQGALKVLRSLSLYPDFNPWRRLCEEFRTSSCTPPCFEPQLPTLRPLLSETNGADCGDQDAEPVPCLVSSCEMARSEKGFAFTTCGAVNGADLPKHADRDVFSEHQGQSHHVAAEDQAHHHGHQKGMHCSTYPLAAAHQVRLDCMRSLPDSEQETGWMDCHHERILGLMAERMDRSRVMFLGTGCAEPSPYRSGTGILLQTAPDAYLMIDVGENTMGQMVRMFGHEGAHHVVQRLQCIWVSHHHGDHCLGLPGILAARDPEGPPIMVVGPVVIGQWLRKVGRWQKLRYIFFHHRDLNESQWALAVRMKLGFLAWESFRVEHCYDAWGLFVQHTSGWKLVFTGDTKVCENVIRAAKDATLLIHEASFGPLHEETAAKTCHSTWEQALHCSQQVKAYRTILTHFSNRYPGYPEEAGRSPELGDRAAIAFDGLQVPLVALRYLPAFNDAFKQAILANSDFRSDR